MIDDSSYTYFSNKSIQLSKQIGGLIRYLKETQKNNPQIRNPQIR